VTKAKTLLIVFFCVGLYQCTFAVRHIVKTSSDVVDIISVFLFLESD